ncbi:hypothetical protein HanRHA438_Chr06g0251191 [Helianthus annuus]|nr:hypothetical protein HanRHA438_Chr06g0251191 [Helianthus annuus]
MLLHSLSISSMLLYLSIICFLLCSTQAAIAYSNRSSVGGARTLILPQADFVIPALMAVWSAHITSHKHNVCSKFSSRLNRTTTIRYTKKQSSACNSSRWRYRCESFPLMIFDTMFNCRRIPTSSSRKLWRAFFMNPTKHQKASLSSSTTDMIGESKSLIP